MSKQFIVKFKVIASKVSVLLDAVAPECELLSVEEFSDSVKKLAKRKRNYPGNTIKNINGKTGIEFTFDIIKEAKNGLNANQLRSAFKNNGRAENSFSPCLTKLKENKKIKWDENTKTWKAI